MANNFANFNAAFPPGAGAAGGAVPGQRQFPPRSGVAAGVAAGAPMPGQTAQQLALKPHEKSLFDSLFYSCEGARTLGAVSGASIKALFTASRLPKASLAQVWALSDRQRRKVLDLEDFYIACRLIALAQQNIPVTYQSLKAYLDIPLPQFDGITPPQGGGITPMQQQMPQVQQQQAQMMQQQQAPVRKNVAPMTTAGPGLSSTPLGGGLGMGAPAASFPVSLGRANPQQVSPPALVDEWSISDAERTQYVSLFSQADADGDGFVGGKEANLFFKQSGLDNATLKQIWLLSDLDRDNKLNPDEFAIAMHFTLRVRKKQALPSSLPPSMDPRNRPQQQQQQQTMQSGAAGLGFGAAAGGPDTQRKGLNMDYLPEILPSPAHSAPPPQLQAPTQQSSNDLLSFDAGAGMPPPGGFPSTTSKTSSRRTSMDFGFGQQGAPQLATPQLPTPQQQAPFAFSGISVNTGVTPVNGAAYAQPQPSLGGGFAGGAAGGEPKYAMIEATQALEDRTQQLHTLTSQTEQVKRAGQAADSRLEEKLRLVEAVTQQVQAQERVLEEQRAHVAAVEKQHAEAEQAHADAKKRLADAQELQRTGDARARELTEQTAALKREAQEIDMSVTLLESQLQTLRSSLKGVEDLKQTQANIVQARRDQQTRLLHEKSELQELLNASKAELANLKEQASVIKSGLQAHQEGVDEMHALLKEHQDIVAQERLRPSPKESTYAKAGAGSKSSTPTTVTKAAPADDRAGAAAGAPAAKAAPKKSSDFSFSGDDDAFNIDDIQLPVLGATASVAPATASPAATSTEPAVSNSSAPSGSLPAKGSVAAAAAEFARRASADWSKPAGNDALTELQKGHHVSTSSAAFTSQSDVFGGQAPSSLTVASPDHASGASPMSASSVVSPPAPAVPSFPSALEGTGVPDAFADDGDASGNPWDDAPSSDPFGSSSAADPFGTASSSTGGSSSLVAPAVLSPTAAAAFGEDDPFGDDPFGAPSAPTQAAASPAAAQPAAAASSPAADTVSAGAVPAAQASTSFDSASFDDFGADFGQAPVSATSPAAAASSPAAAPASVSPTGASAKASVTSPAAAPVAPAAASKKEAVAASFESAMTEDWAAFD